MDRHTHARVCIKKRLHRKNGKRWKKGRKADIRKSTARPLCGGELNGMAYAKTEDSE